MLLKSSCAVSFVHIFLLCCTYKKKAMSVQYLVESIDISSDTDSSESFPILRFSSSESSNGFDGSISDQNNPAVDIEHHTSMVSGSLSNPARSSNEYEEVNIARDVNLF